MRRFLLIIIIIVQSQFSISQKLEGEYSVAVKDRHLPGSNYNIRFTKNNEFALLDRQYRGIKLGKGTYDIEKDSIAFIFNSEETSRANVNEEVINDNSRESISLTFKLYTQIRFDSIDFFDIGIAGKQLDSFFTSEGYLGKIDMPASNDTLTIKVTVGNELYDRILFTTIPNASKNFMLWTTYYHDDFITNNLKFKIQRIKRKTFIMSQNGIKKTYKKNRNSKLFGTSQMNNIVTKKKS